MNDDSARAVPLYVQIAQQLRDQIARGELAAGERLPSEAELCQLYSASRVTVRKAIEGLVKEGIVRARAGKGTFVEGESSDERRAVDLHERSRRPTLTGTVGFISIGDRTPFVLDILYGIQRAADRNDTHVIFANAEYDRHQQARHIVALRERMVDGLLILPTFDVDERLQQLVADDYPAMLIDRHFENIALPCVTSDNRDGGSQAGRYLCDLGHQRIAFIAHLPISTSEERWAGYRAALTEYGIPIDDRLTLTLNTVLNDEAHVLTTGYATESSVYHDVRQFIDQRRPSAVICYNQYFALLTIAALHDLGLRIADDVSLVSFDCDGQRNAVDKPLTIVGQNGFTVGNTAFARLQRILSGVSNEPRITRLPMRLIVSDSCRRFTGP